MSAAQNSYAAAVEIYFRDRPIGGAVCVAARILVTAAHVIEGLDVADLSVVDGAPDAPRTNVLFIKKDPTLDVAAIHVEGDLRIESIRQPTSGESWQTKAPASRADLSGTVTSTRRNWENGFGRTVPALQLHVDQSVADFHGYSGSAVEARQDGATLAILVEQLPSRGGHVTRASSANVLYAIPIVSACDALGVEPARKLARARAPLPAAMEYHEQVVASLRGYRSRLTAEGLQFVTPPVGTPWRPSALWSSLTQDNVGSVLLTGYGGVGKTRTLLEVGDIATSFGWDVIHVRGVNAARVADVISERVRETGSAPILLLSDYLNLAREIDLLALTELANSDEGRPRLRILATSRTSPPP